MSLKRPLSSPTAPDWKRSKRIESEVTFPESRISPELAQKLKVLLLQPVEEGLTVFPRSVRRLYLSESHCWLLDRRESELRELELRQDINALLRLLDDAIDGRMSLTDELTAEPQIDEVNQNGDVARLERPLPHQVSLLSIPEAWCLHQEELQR